MVAAGGHGYLEPVPGRRHRRSCYDADTCACGHGDLSTHRRYLPLARLTHIRSKVSPTASQVVGWAQGQHVDTTIAGLPPFVDLEDHSRCLADPPGFLSIFDSWILLVGEDVPLLVYLRRQKHRQNRGIGVTDRINTHPADHRRHRAVGFGFHPGCTVFQSEMWKAGQ